MMDKEWGGDRHFFLEDMDSSVVTTRTSKVSTFTATSGGFIMDQALE